MTSRDDQEDRHVHAALRDVVARRRRAWLAHRDFSELEAALLACPWFAVEPADWGEARRVFRELAARGPLHHRQVKIPDLLIAAVAARNGIIVVHYDSDYEIIAGVTGQPTRWAAPRGTI